MRIHSGFDNLPPIRRAAVTVGSFDGVHRGHRLLIAELSDVAHERLHGESVVVTFDPHPRLVLKGENRLLTTLPEKLELLAQTGVDHVVVVRFTPEFSRIGSEAFTRDYLIGKLGAEVVLSGEGHHFGHNRSGSTALLESSGILTKNLGRFDNISSTAIRAAIEAGEMEEAADMLGGPYLVLTDLPREPTKLLPPDGEYSVLVDDGQVPVRMVVDDSVFGGAVQRIRIVGK